MAIETRNGRTYYYRSRWIDGRVVRKYVAAGAAAVQAAKRDQEIKELRRRQQEQVLQQLGTFDNLTEQINVVIEINNVILAASLLAAGFHQHKSQWRKCNDRQSREAEQP